MTDFVQTMKDWRRMCNKYFKGKNWVCNKTCPMYAFEVCSKPMNKYPTPLEIGDDLAHEIECVIMTWAAEHPEPVYGTWLEFIKRFETGERKSDNDFIIWMGTTPIPANIAEKLGLKPKE